MATEIKMRYDSRCNVCLGWRLGFRGDDGCICGLTTKGK